MKKSNLIISISLFVLAASTIIIVGCGSKEDTPIVTINDKNLYMDDFLYDIYLVETEGNALDNYYQNNLGTSYWDFEYEGSKMRDLAKTSVLTRVVMNEILSDQAKRNGLTLSEKELANNKKAIENLFNTDTEEAFRKVGLTRAILTKAYNKVSLSDKYHFELSKDFKIDENSIRESLNQDDYREYKTECLFVPIVSVEDKTLPPLTEEEITEANTIINVTLAKIKKGTEFDTLLNEEERLSYHPRNFVYGDSVYEKEYQDSAITLDNGDYSEVITTKYGYYIIHMLDNYSTDRYEQAVEDAIRLEEDTQFEKVYNGIKDQYNITINFDYWSSITLGSITTLDEE